MISVIDACKIRRTNAARQSHVWVEGGAEVPLVECFRSTGVLVHRGNVKVESLVALDGARDGVRARVIHARGRAVIWFNERLTH